MEDSDLSNKVSEMCLNFYDKLPNSKRLHKDSEWTILSAIVMQRSNVFEVVAMGTGTKCIGSSMLSNDGGILNDSHAEIIARRAFIRFLLCQINSVTRAQSIFQANDDENAEDGKRRHFVLANDVKFHMFTTSSPCGDASIFATSDNHDDDDGEPEAKRLKVDVGFTGAKLMFDEDVEDPMDQTEGKIRTKPGKGDRTMSLSCSDKIARWNMLGIQGCMLSSLIDPIYLTSIIFAAGTPFNYVAMQRALWKRFLSAEKFLETPFHLNQPKILIASNKMTFVFARNEKRVNPSSNSIIFTKVPDNMRPIEVGVSGKRQGITKKTIHTRKAHLRISKVELFSDYMNIVRQSEKLRQHLFPAKNINFDDLCYKDVKTFADNKYCTQWRRLREQLLPKWTRKNENLINFKAFPIPE